MCLSALFLINSKGEIVLFRLYRDDVTLSAANAFRLQVRSPLPYSQQILQCGYSQLDRCC